MGQSLGHLIGELKQDRLRGTVDFDSDMKSANAALHDLAKSDFEIAQVLRGWLKKHQPCLFGRIGASKPDLLSFCILREPDLMGSGQSVRDKIQAYRRQWKRDAYRGRKSAFIVAALMPDLVSAAPDQHLLTFSQKLCEQYLLEPIAPDQLYHDRVMLGVDEPDGSEREWKVGVNFFSAQGHGRWWHDHRVPGGVVFSANSVGHMVRSARDLNAMSALDASADRTKRTIEDLGNALKHAMLTIAGAAETVSGRATWLKPSTDASGQCPFDAENLPANLRGKDWSSYCGWYHTDHTIPSSYFKGSAKRPADLTPQDLDFTYLHDRAFDNPEFETMGQGVVVR